MKMGMSTHCHSIQHTYIIRPKCMMRKTKQTSSVFVTGDIKFCDSEIATMKNTHSIHNNQLAVSHLLMFWPSTTNSLNFIHAKAKKTKRQVTSLDIVAECDPDFSEISRTVASANKHVPIGQSFRSG